MTDVVRLKLTLISGDHSECPPQVFHPDFPPCPILLYPWVEGTEAYTLMVCCVPREVLVMQQSSTSPAAEYFQRIARRWAAENGLRLTV